MTTTTTEPSVRNGVDTTALFTTLDAVNGATRAGQVPVPGHQHLGQRHPQHQHHRRLLRSQPGDEPERRLHLPADHPPVLTGSDHGPTPVEFLLHALAACLTAGLVNIAAARGVHLTSVSSTVTGDIDLLGIFGLDRDVRNGYSGIKVAFNIDGDATPEELAGLVERSRQRSAVLRHADQRHRRRHRGHHSLIGIE